MANTASKLTPRGPGHHRRLKIKTCPRELQGTKTNQQNPTTTKKKYGERKRRHLQVFEMGKWKFPDEPKEWTRCLRGHLLSGTSLTSSVPSSTGHGRSHTTTPARAAALRAATPPLCLRAGQPACEAKLHSTPRPALLSLQSQTSGSELFIQKIRGRRFSFLSTSSYLHASLPALLLGIRAFLLHTLTSQRTAT